MSMVDDLDLAQMRADQADSLHDTCVILSHSESQDSFGEMVSSWTSGTSLACGFEPTGGKERPRSGGSTHPAGTLLVVDARLRLPLTVSLGVKDKVRITHRYGEALAVPLTFGVAGLPRRGASGLVVDLQEVS